MSSISSANSTHQADDSLTLLKRALPIRKRRELLTTLTQFWRESLESPECTVLYEMPQPGEYAAVFSAHQEAPEYRLLLASQQSSDQEWMPLCTQTFSAKPQRAISLSDRGQTRGAVVWSSAISPDDNLLATTVLLLTQLREIELLQPNGIGVDWFHRRKQEALIEFAAGAGHEINNPVAAISGRVQLLLRDEADLERRDSLATIGAQAMRISQMIGDTMQYAEPPPVHATRCELGAAVKDILGKLNSRLKEQGTQVKLSRPDEVWIAADKNQLSTAIAELMTNSLNALGQGGIIKVTIEPPETRLPGFAKLEISDNGPGLSESDRQHLFDPFYSGRQAGRGLGFGLCKCWRIVTAHGGTIEASSVPWVQTALTTFWPMA